MCQLIHFHPTSRKVSRPRLYVFLPTYVAAIGTGCSESNQLLEYVIILSTKGKDKAVPLHAMEALGGRESIATTHSRPRH
jgi:hypothetical protein